MSIYYIEEDENKVQASTANSEIYRRTLQLFQQLYYNYWWYASCAFLSYDVVKLVSYLVSWCFKPCQPQRNISGLRAIFIRRHIVEMINKAEIRLEEQSEKAESCLGEFME